MCGDTMCGSCGPAQGYNPEFERAVETLCEKFPVLADREDNLAEDLVTYIEEMIRKECENIAAFVKARVPGKQGENLAYEILSGELPPEEEELLAREYEEWRRQEGLE
jgi:hypothetical protein